VSDAEDAKAIQDYLREAGVQAYAAMEACTTLDDETRARALDLAGRVAQYVNDGSPELWQGKALRNEFNAMIEELAQKGCGDVAKAIHDTRGTQKAAPPPTGTPNPLLSIFGGVNVEGLILLWVAYEFLFRKGRR
jgi:hypothetical protein